MRINKQTIEETKVVPRTIVTYECDEPGCMYKTTFERDADDHTAEEHTYIGFKVVRNLTFYKFDTEEALKKLVKYKDDFGYGRWTGPGWYGCRVEDDIRMGCNVGTLVNLYPAREFLEEAHEMADNALALVAGLEDLLRSP